MTGHHRCRYSGRYAPHVHLPVVQGVAKVACRDPVHASDCYRIVNGRPVWIPPVPPKKQGLGIPEGGAIPNGNENVEASRHRKTRTEINRERRELRAIRDELDDYSSWGDDE